MNEDARYVIYMEDTLTHERTYCHYEGGWGYLLGSVGIGSATLMSYETAISVYNDMLESKPQGYSDGTIYPPNYIHRGLNLSNIKPSGEGRFVMAEVKLADKHDMPVRGDIIRCYGQQVDDSKLSDDTNFIRGVELAKAWISAGLQYNIEALGGKSKAFIDGFKKAYGR